MVLGAVLFGVNASVSKVVLTAGIEPARLAALRATGSAMGLVVILVVIGPGRLRVPLRSLPRLAVLGVCGAALIQWFYFVAIDRLPVGIALLIEFTGPLIVALWARVVQRQAVARSVWLSLGLALVGLAMVAEVWSDAGLDGIGVAAALAAACCLATFYLLGQHSLAHHDAVGLTAWMFVFASLFWAVVQPWWNFDPSILFEQTSLLGELSSTSVPVWTALAWVVVLGTLVPYLCNLAALRHLPATASSVVGMLEPVLAAAVAWWWLGEVLSPVQLVGGALVLAGVTLVQLARTRAPGAEPVVGVVDAPLA